MDKYVDTYIDTYVETYIETYIDAYVDTYADTYIDTTLVLAICKYNAHLASVQLFCTHKIHTYIHTHDLVKDSSLCPISLKPQMICAFHTFLSQ
jgi:hypothetical protein